ncbi:hypothetical protein [Novosphingobium album (ex Hu et al. 2023)]|uniref:Uncharacterized protein n=1 Tax=Novosphingobium album (ex Hu et al. 2023) TaxID=2930093 RepID=A0ABT0B6Z3_9SPHN|nr:hypothetical protein [Novosphingobium album (ex Hu et al. 2023)]MCJ2180835.1 hypothetical protein [Novosphingobium album (ex Hu et al. 2023)]
MTHKETGLTRPEIGRYQISTVPFDRDLVLRSATYTPSGRVLVTYAKDESQGERQLALATMDDDGQNFRPFFSQLIPQRPKDNGIRLMVFPDDRRIFLGDFVIECSTSLETCKDPALLPVEYPAEVAIGDYISHRWSEIVVAPDNRHIAWNALLSNFAVAVFTGELRKSGGTYAIVSPQIVSTLDPFRPDPDHPGGVLPAPLRGGEVKQFIHGGTALSMVGAVRRDVPDSVALSLVTGKTEAITDTPGYTETTIFSPDERLGITMTSRFSRVTDPAILGLVPRPYPDSLNIGVSMLAYTYAVTGVRNQRPGNIGPALIDIQASKTQEGYQGMDLNTQEDWVYYSPMSWSPDGRKAMWIEGRRDSPSKRIQLVTLPDYRPGPPVAAATTPDRIAFGSSDLSRVEDYARAAQDIDVKVYGRKSGYLTYRHMPGGVIEKHYFDFSDDGTAIYSGDERLEANPLGRSTYRADLRLTGPKPGAMHLRMTFGPLGGLLPAQLIFSPDSNGLPLTRGYAEYDGHRLDVSTLVP